MSKCLKDCASCPAYHLLNDVAIVPDLSNYFCENNVKPINGNNFSVVINHNYNSIGQDRPKIS